MAAHGAILAHAEDARAVAGCMALDRPAGWVKVPGKATPRSFETGRQMARLRFPATELACVKGSMTRGCSRQASGRFQDMQASHRCYHQKARGRHVGDGMARRQASWLSNRHCISRRRPIFSPAGSRRAGPFCARQLAMASILPPFTR